MGLTRRPSGGCRWQFLIFVVALCLLPALPVNAGPDPAGLTDRWRWRLFGAESGLPQSGITSFHETLRGEFWILSRTGMAWFNGHHWEMVPGTSADPDFAHARAVVDSAGLLLISPPVLYRVDHHGYTPIPLQYDGSPVAVVKAAPQKGAGLIIQGDSALYLLHAGVLTRLASPFDDPIIRSIPDNPFGIFPTRAGAVLLNAPSGLHRYGRDGWTCLLPVSGGYLTVNCAIEDSAGNGLMSGRIGRDYAQWEWNSSGNVTQTDHQPGDTFPSADHDPEGRIFLLRLSGDVSIRSENGWQVLSPPPPELLGAGFLHFDSGGNLWVGRSDGLWRCGLSSTLWRQLAEPGSGLNNAVNALLHASDGSLWAGTSAGIRIYRDGVRVREFREINGTPATIITGLAEDRQGHIWASSGASFGGAFRWDGREWRHFGSREGLSDNAVHQITTDRQGRLWFLTISTLAPGLFPELEDGAFIHDGNTFERLDTRDGLPHGRVYAMAEDDAGVRWFATLGGIGRWDRGQWAYWSTKNGLRTDRVFTLTVGRDRRVWFGHQTQGVGSIDTNGVLTYETPASGFLSRGAWDLRVDDAGRLWVSTREGLMIRDRGIWSTLSSAEGLPDPNLWPILIRDSLVYCGTMHAGIAILDLTELEGVQPFVRFDEPVDRGDLLTIRWHVHAPLQIPFDHQALTRHRIDDGQWSGWGTVRTLDIVGLGPGSHRLTVQTRGPLARADQGIHTYPFTVPLPFYLRPAFLLPISTLVLLLGITAFGFVRKRRELAKKTREQDARFRAVVEHQTDMIVRVRPDGRLTFANGAVTRFLRRPQQDIIGRPFAEVFGVDPGQSMVTGLWDPASSIRPAEIDLPVADASGTERWVRWSSASIDDERGALPEFQLVGRDITDRKDAERELARSEERYRIVAESTGQLVYDYDVAHGTILWSGAITLVTGYAPAEFERFGIREWEESIHPEDRQAALDAMEKAASLNFRYAFEYRFRRKDGSYVDIFDNGLFIADASGGAERMLGTMTDISERKRADLRLAASLHEKEILLKEIHHRVKNNLQVISSLLSLQSAATKDDRTQEQLRESQNRVRSMALIHERLYQSADLARIDFGEYVRSLTAFLFRSYDVHGITVQYHLDHVNLPVNTAIPCGLIINELVSNALKYAFAGRTGGEIEISITVIRGRSAVLSVRDNGIGFPADLDFRRTQTLGLQLVNTLTMQINGTIGLIRDRGTTFSITLPLED